jgi:hypothetical protein
MVARLACQEVHPVIQIRNNNYYSRQTFQAATYCQCGHINPRGSPVAFKSSRSVVLKQQFPLQSPQLTSGE